MRCAKARAASTKTGSFISTSDCSGVLVRARWRGAKFARRRIERDERRIDRGAPPIDVEAAPIQVGALRSCVIVAAHLIDLPSAGRLRGLDALSAELRVENAGDGERVVADDFGVEPLARAAGEQTVLAVACEQLPA